MKENNSLRCLGRLALAGGLALMLEGCVSPREKMSQEQYDEIVRVGQIKFQEQQKVIAEKQAKITAVNRVSSGGMGMVGLKQKNEGFHHPDTLIDNLCSFYEYIFFPAASAFIKAHGYYLFKD